MARGFSYIPLLLIPLSAALPQAHATETMVADTGKTCLPFSYMTTSVTGKRDCIDTDISGCAGEMHITFRCSERYRVFVNGNDYGDIPAQTQTVSAAADSGAAGLTVDLLGCRRNDASSAAVAPPAAGARLPSCTELVGSYESGAKHPGDVLPWEIRFVPVTGDEPAFTYRGQSAYRPPHNPVDELTSEIPVSGRVPVWLSSAVAWIALAALSVACLLAFRKRHAKRH
jgi:hypothetical protein